MVRGRENLAHKCVVTISHKIGSIFLHQREKSESHTLIDKEHGLLVLPFENGGNKEWTYYQIEQRDLALSSKSQYVYHSRIPAVRTEYSSSQRIKSRKKTDSSEWLLHPKVFQEFSWLLGSPTIDLFASRLCQKLEQMSSLCISPFQYDFKNAPKNKTGMCSSSDFDYTSLGTQNSSSSVSGNQCCCPRDKKFW